MIVFNYFKGPLQTECSKLSVNNDHLTNTMKVDYLKIVLALSFLRNQFLIFLYDYKRLLSLLKLR